MKNLTCDSMSTATEVTNLQDLDSPQLEKEKNALTLRTTSRAFSFLCFECRFYECVLEIYL